MATKLHALHDEFGQSPWLDNLTRGHLDSGQLARFVADGVRGVTANPTIFAKAIEGSTDYDADVARLGAQGCDPTTTYWHLVVDDVVDAARLLRPVHDGSGGTDGFVSIEVAPELARDSAATVATTTELHRRIALPNVYVKIPATPEGIEAVEEAVAHGHNINITLIFSLDRYQQVMAAYTAGLERYVRSGGDPARVHSVASFFLSRVDTEVDRRLTSLGGREALALRGKAAVAQAKLAYASFRRELTSARWARLAGQGAHAQLPLWASTSTKNPDYRDTMYVDDLIGPDTINTMPESTIASFEHHGRLDRTLERDVDDAAEVMARLAAVGIDMDAVGRLLEDQGVAAFHASFAHVLRSLGIKAQHLVER